MEGRKEEAIVEWREERKKRQWNGGKNEEAIVEWRENEEAIVEWREERRSDSGMEGRTKKR